MNPAPLRLRALAHPDDLPDSAGDESSVPTTRSALPVADDVEPTTSVAQRRRFREWDDARPDLDTDSVDEPSSWGPRGAGGSWSLGRAGGAALLVVVLVCAGFALAKIMRSEPHSVTAPQLPGVEEVAAGEPKEDTAPAPGAARQPEKEEPASDIVVSVVGLVYRPGLVTLGPGARVADALAAAGGSRDDADMTSLNLARPIADGEQVVVGSVPPDSPPPPGSTILAAGGDDQTAQGSGPGDTAGGAASGGDGKVNLNSATAAELESLNGVGPATAAAILDYRESSGPFTSVEQLGEVNGIGPAKLENLRDQVAV